jgi:hypothetical protein
MADSDLTNHDNGISRRSALKRIGAGAAIAWSAPVLMSVRSPAFAASRACDCIFCHALPFGGFLRCAPSPTDCPCVCACGGTPFPCPLANPCVVQITCVLSPTCP